MEGIIYKIYFTNNNKIYIGSTFRTLRERKTEHHSRCYNSKCDAYNKKLYKYIRNNNDWENIKFEIIKKFNFINKKDLHNLERNYIRNCSFSLNVSGCNEFILGNYFLKKYY